MNPWVYRRPDDIHRRARARLGTEAFVRYGSMPTVLCIKNVIGHTMTATATGRLMKATATGQLMTATATSVC